MMKMVSLVAETPVKLDISHGVFEVQNQAAGELLVTDSHANAVAGVGFKVAPGGGYHTPGPMEAASWPEVWLVGFGPAMYRRVGA